MRIIWQTVRRITCEILGVKGLTNRFHAVMCLFGNKSQMMSNVVSVGKNACKALLSVSLVFLTHFDVFCDLLLYRPQQHRIYLLNTIKCNVVYGDVICASFFQKIILTNQNVCIQPMIYNANRTEFNSVSNHMTE